MSNTNSTDYASRKFLTVYSIPMPFEVLFLHRRYVRSSQLYDQLLHQAT